MTKITHSAQQTEAVGRAFSRILNEKDVVVLEGVLGGGKTTFVKGVLKGLKIHQRAQSPSFTLMRQYQNRKIRIYHIDLYRITPHQAFDVGLLDYLYAPKSAALIEWGDKIKNYLPSYIAISFSFQGVDSRRIAFSFQEYDKKRYSLLMKNVGRIGD
ncbi:MAG: tRNA (adenosine(37)-N6)-threonylcarbamoyltransferase complex ATPase subunit type 1 TsaE [Candidatus Omnitrophota bacterium]|nr:MAG: tRNA (adenosine(37)-N6)-threonylcarbamoyltransferase complex ATPase subunit type 1 TsaE [Candidatus Omnitrophota bacterium]